MFRRLVSAHDQERRRISRDIHDHLGQQMTALRLTLESIDGPRDPDSSGRDGVERARQLAADIDQSLDFLTWELRPVGGLEEFGLAIALQDLVSGWSERFGIGADFQGPTPETLRLSTDVAANLYSVAQEALHNVVKHARAGHVSVSLDVGDHETVVKVKDDGRGFDASGPSAKQGLGLISMRERATLCGGTVDIDSAPGRGTTVCVRIPNVAEAPRPDV